MWCQAWLRMSDGIWSHPLAHEKMRDWSSPNRKSPTPNARPGASVGTLSGVRYQHTKAPSFHGKSANVSGRCSRQKIPSHLFVGPRNAYPRPKRSLSSVSSSLDMGPSPGSSAAQADIDATTQVASRRIASISYAAHALAVDPVKAEVVHRRLERRRPEVARHPLRQVRVVK